MAYPRKLLNPGEEIVLDLRQHWIALTSAILWTLLVVVALVALLVVGSGWSLGVKLVLVLVAVVAFACLAGWRIAKWLTRHFVLTTQRVISRSGVIANRALDIPLDTVNDIHFTQSILERVFGSGNLMISSASDLGNNWFKFIRDPERVQNEVYRQREEAERAERMEAARFTAQAQAEAAARAEVPAQAPPPAAGHGWSGTAQPPPPGDDIPTQIARLAELRDRGALTDDEFLAKKRELLGRM